MQRISAQTRYAAHTMVAMTLLGISMATLAQWQEGDFNGELNWQGAVTQNRNPWAWAQSGLPSSGTLNQKDLQAEGGMVAWHNLLIQTPVLVGKTGQLMPSGRPGVSPVIQFGRDIPGFSLTWKGAGVAEVTAPVSAQGEHGTVSGTLTFSLRVAGLMVATTAGSRHGYGVTAGGEDNGNGLPPAGQALAWQAAVSALQGMTGQDAPGWLTGGVTDGGMTTLSALHEPQNQAAGAMYGAEILPGSGTLRFPAGNVPAHWHVSLPVRITYR